MRFFAAAMAFVAAALVPGDRPGLPLAEGFVVAHRESVRGGTIEERVPQGETVQEWSRMITLLTINADMPPGDYIDAFERHFAAECPGAPIGPRTATKVGAYPTLDGRSDCALLPATGKPQSYFYRIFRVGSTLHIAQIGFRRVPSASDTAWAQAQLSALGFCAAASVDPVCQ